MGRFSAGRPICSFLTLALSILHPPVKALSTYKSKHCRSSGEPCTPKADPLFVLPDPIALGALLPQW